MTLTKEMQRKVEENMGLVGKVISDKIHGLNTPNFYSYDDLFQIGCIGLCKAAYTTTVSDHYFRACYQRRNKFMVNHSSLVIAVWNGTPSGTQNTIDYAKKRGVKAINIIE